VLLRPPQIDETPASAPPGNDLLPGRRRASPPPAHEAAPLLPAADAFEEIGDAILLLLSSVGSLPSPMHCLLEAEQGVHSCQREAKMLSPPTVGLSLIPWFRMSGECGLYISTFFYRTQGWICA
jgi:hypothetical protein